MSEILVRGNSILVDSPDAESAIRALQPGSALVSWVVSRVEAWEKHRNNNYSRLWAKYWRLWRGFWSEEDKNRQSERSRLIAPALAQAIEMSVAEIEEAVFSREGWFDIADDVDDTEREDMLIIRDRLLEDTADGGLKDAVCEGVLNSALSGTGIIKMSPEEVQDEQFVQTESGLRLQKVTRALITYHPIRADEFIPDPAGTTIQNMLGCAHKFKRPTHYVLERIAQGMYRADARHMLGSATPLSSGREMDATDPMRQTTSTVMDDTEIIEYHGKVPRAFLTAVTNPRAAYSNPIDQILDELDTNTSNPEEDDGVMCEAIVTIANGSVLLRAMKNPFMKGDRAIVAWQYETVPGRFWGRGVAEKGYNPQLALDNELRARQDALGFISAPMLGVDTGRIPRGFKLEVKPGKVWLTQGNPSEVLQPLRLGEVNSATFNQTSEMERMVQMGTGAFDTASAIGQGGQTASGGSAATAGSMLMGAFVKRTKRALQNVDRKCLTPLIAKSLWRYMELDPVRYPHDAKFQVKATLGVVAREVEVLNLTQLMGMLPEEFPQVKVAIAQGIIELANLHNKPTIVKAMEQALAPPSEEEQKRQQEIMEMEFEKLRAETQNSLLENQKVIAEIREILSKVAVNMRRADVEDDKVNVEKARVQLQAAEIDQFAEQNQIARKRLELQEKQVDARIAQMARQ